MKDSERKESDKEGVHSLNRERGKDLRTKQTGGKKEKGTGPERTPKEKKERPAAFGRKETEDGWPG